MTLTCTQHRGDDTMVSNQHRDHDRVADHLFLGEAIQHLRHRVQHAVPSGWTAETTEDGDRLVVADADGPFREILAETVGVWREPVQDYLVTVQPVNMLSLLALLEALDRSIETVPPAVRAATIEFAEKILGRRRRPLAPRRPQSW